jgi:DNA-binding PadR family transcriptional regulator
MTTQDEEERLDMLQGTLDLLILRTLILGPEHGQGIARAIQHTSDDELRAAGLYVLTLRRGFDSPKRVG